ncbi:MULTISPECIES: DVU3141 family protein [Nitrincola]|uniref:Surface antigen domain-containing protein n=1 Tax=Nitrincola nitratireducens TaxID=1229521 RepID=W9UU46_9GAMM|nr:MULTISPECIES: DVU3141 family protein [Nitrincola]EXJ10619.1 hypothetical protein D791_02450 [Nitrincola nitratireducens]
MVSISSAHTKALVLGSFVFLLSACAQFPQTPQHDAAHSTRTVLSPSVYPPLPADISQYFSDSLQASLIALPTSPWGSNVEIELQDAYFAANGRLCRAFFVRDISGQASERLACQTSAKQWQEVRPVTRILNTSSHG